MTTLLGAAAGASASGASAAGAAGPAAAAATVDPLAVLSLAEADADAAADALHDGALQALVVARYAADAAVRGGDTVAARDAVQEALVALRRAVWLLRPRGDQGLVQALRDLAVHLPATGRAPLVLDVDEPAAEAADALPAEAATAAYRLVQHAAGRQPLTVRVRRTPAGLQLDLDTAVPDPAGEALRARAVGGDLRSTPHGARLRLPLGSRPPTPPLPDEEPS